MAINKVEIVKYKLEERDGWHGGCQTICLNRHIRSLPVSVLGIRLNIIVIVRSPQIRVISAQLHSLTADSRERSVENHRNSKVELRC